MPSIPIKSSSAREMAEAAINFVDSLDPDQKELATFEYMDGERLFWYYPPLNRHGLPFMKMNDTQRKLAHALMASGLTDTSYEQAKQIIELELILGAIEKEEGTPNFVRDPDRYYFTVFGDPSSYDSPWGWRVEGHHISLHFSIWADAVISTTPFFFGSNPAEVLNGPKAGQRILSTREDIAMELINSMDDEQLTQSVIFDEAPLDILTYNSSKAMFAKEEGLSASKMSGTQRETLMNLVSEYVNQVHTDLAQKKLAILVEKGIEGLHFAWGGSLEKDKPHYYRIHGGDFVVEFDNRQNGANHIHSVWRDVENDFAQDVLRQHLLTFHVL